MLKFRLGKLGEHTPKIPNSLAVIFEMVTAWSDEPTKTELGFICAAAVSLSIEAEGETPTQGRKTFVGVRSTMY